MHSNLPFTELTELGWHTAGPSAWWEKRNHSSCKTTVAGFVSCRVGLIFAVSVVQRKPPKTFYTRSFVNSETIFHSQCEIQSLLDPDEILILSSMPKWPSKEMLPPKRTILLPHSTELKLLESPGFISCTEKFLFLGVSSFMIEMEHKFYWNIFT